MLEKYDRLRWKEIRQLDEKLLARGEQFDKKRRRWKRWQKVVSALACVVVFCTTYALILPAITMERTTYCEEEEHEHTLECYLVPAGLVDEETDSQPLLQDEVPLLEGDSPDEETDDGQDVAGNPEARENSVGTLPVTSISGLGTIYDKETDTFKANVNLTFAFPAEATITAGDVYTYTYPAGIIIPAEELNQKKVLMDGSKRAGTYEFVKNADGTYAVQIVFNDEYVALYCNKNEKVTGYVNFAGQFSKSCVQEDGSIHIGSGDLVIQVPVENITYPKDETESYNISATKNGQWVKAENKLVYTVYVRTTKGTPDPISFTDTLTDLDSLKLGEPTVTVERGTTQYHNGWQQDIGTLTKVSDVNPVYDPNTHQLTMTLEGLEKTGETTDYVQAEFYKITYTYPITDDSWSGEIKPNNTVSVEAKDTTKGQTVKAEDDTEVRLSKDTSYTLNKSGEEKGNRIKWTITVNKNQVDIAGAELSDEMLKSAEDLTVTPSGGYVQDSTTGTITFEAVSDGKNENQYTIVYYTPIGENQTAGSNITNHAQFDPTPNGESGDEKDVDCTVTITDVSLNKSGAYDQNSGKIQWKIDVNSNGKDIAGTTLTDTFFGELQENDLTIEPASGYTFVKDTEGKITSITFNGVNASGENNQHYTITYATVPDTENLGTETKVSNTAALHPGEGGIGPGVTSEVTVPQVAVTKTGSYQDSHISWTITVNAKRRDIAGYELTDTMFSGLKASDIKVRYNLYSTSDDVPSDEYTIQTNESGYATGIVFHAASGSDVNTKQYFLIYNTPAEPEWNARTETNELHFKKGDVDIPAVAEVTVPGIKKVAKQANGGIKPSEDGKTGSVEWTVTVDVPPTGLPKGVTLTDDVTKDHSGNANMLHWMTWEQIITNGFSIYWKDDNGNTIGTSNPYDANGHPVFELKFLASDGKEYDFKTINENGSDYFRPMTYTILTMTFTNGLEVPEGNAIPTHISFSYSTTVDLEHSEIGTTHFYNAVEVDGEKADSYVDHEKPGVVKTDGNGNAEKSETSSDGELVWKVKVKTVGNAIQKLTVTDTLPKGVLPKTIFVEGDQIANVLLSVNEDHTIAGDGNPYRYAGTFDPTTREIVLEVTSLTGDGVLLENQEWNFTFTCEADDATLPTGSTYELTNTVIVKTDTEILGSDSQTQEWTHTKSAEESKVVQKGGEWDNTNKILNYSIVLNPEGKDIVEGVDTLTLIDTLKYQSTHHQAEWYQGTDWAYFTMKADLIQNSVRLYQAVWDKEKAAWVKDVENKDFSWVYKTEKSEYWGSTVTSTLTVKGIPDGCPLIFEYAYKVSSDAEDHPDREKIKLKLPFSNEAKLEGTNQSDSSNSSNEKWSHSSSSAGVTTEYHTYTFYKVAKDNYNNALPGAVFSVDEYDKTEGQWIPIHTYTTDDEGKFMVTFDDVKENGDEIYKYNTLYRISETKAPEGYLISEEKNAWYFYFSNSKEENHLPDTIESGAVDLSSEASAVYVENIRNTTEITVEKQWQDKDGNPIDYNSGSVTIQLYQKTNQESNSGGETSPMEGTLYETVILNPGNNWKHTFTELPATGTDEDGNAVTYYYYVKEISVTNYITSYKNNDGINVGTITVINQATDTPIFALPETGGSGTLRYIIGGILLMLASVLLYIKIHLKEGKKGHS